MKSDRSLRVGFTSLFLLLFIVFITITKYSTIDYAASDIERIQNIQKRTYELSKKISLESLKKNKDLHQLFVRMWDVAVYTSPVLPSKYLIVMVDRSTITKFDNLLCNLSPFRMMSRIAVVTLDISASEAIRKKFPMINILQVDLEGLLSDLPLNTPDRHIITSQLMEILKLRLGAVIGRKNIDILIVTPNQVWTENILDRPYYKDRGHRLGYPEFRSSLLVQKIGTPMDETDFKKDWIDLSSIFILGRYNSEGAMILEKTADLLSQRFTSSGAALTFQCDYAKRYLCRRLLHSTMTSSDWFTSVRNKVPSLVHLPDVSSDELKNEGLWFLNKDGSCNITLAENAGDNLQFAFLRNVDMNIPKYNRYRRKFQLNIFHPNEHTNYLEGEALNILGVE